MTVQDWAMPQRSNQLQRLVTALHACLAPGTELEESALLTDRRTNIDREVDVLLKFHAGDYLMLLAIEVVDWSRPAGTPWVEQMSAKHHDLPTDKLVLVSGSGFTGPAQEKAKALNIETLTIDDAGDVDWMTILDLCRDGVFQLMHLKYECVLHVEGNDDWVVPKRGDRIRDPRLRETIDIRQIANSMLSVPGARDILMDHASQTGEQAFHMMLYPPNRWEYGRSEGAGTPIVRVCLGLQTELVATPIEFAAMRFRDHEFLVAQEISDEGNLVVALRRDSIGLVDGVLYDEKCVRRLIPERGDG